MGGGGRTSSNANYNSQSTMYQTNTKNEANVVNTNQHYQTGDNVIQNNAFKVQVAGNMGDGSKMFLLNLDDITQVQLPNG